jgi:hypothetical protein
MSRAERQGGRAFELSDCGTFNRESRDTSPEASVVVVVIVARFGILQRRRVMSGVEGNIIGEVQWVVGSTGMCCEVRAGGGGRGLSH